ncbi:hypothetical protein DPMN_012575 [Dreissena polymorpha]|uniref:Uncharacterized protein n=1 Tax=Dreissena polymorpha TaxID=45954 RepID=A0A9D4S123_DREPO|nr:hypothetical protein DPMN_012575 [Dreissena polymorpha]
MAQLLQYNCFSKTIGSLVTNRHTKEREPPFPIFMGMSCRQKARKKVLVELLNEHGLCIPYIRVFEVSAQLGDAAAGRFIEEGLVCPTILRKGIFTTAAMDNIDHNPTSTTSSSSFHGTSISLFQHPSSGEDCQKRNPFSIRNNKAKKVPELTDSYTNFPLQSFWGNLSSKTRHCQCSTYSKSTTRFTL